MSQAELLKIAFFIGVEAALNDAHLSDTEKTAAMERIVRTAADIAKSRAAREAAKRAKPGFLARLFGMAPKDPARLRAQQRAMAGGLATDTAAFGRYRAQNAPLRSVGSISG